MKVVLTIAFIVCLAVAYSQSQVDEIECPDENEENVTFVPNPYNCNTYFVCQGGDPIPMKCPKGLHFNPKIHVCDWPAKAKCVPKKPDIV